MEVSHEQQCTKSVWFAGAALTKAHLVHGMAQDPGRNHYQMALVYSFEQLLEQF